MGYRGLVAEQNRARDLRAESWTLQDIADELGVAKSSVSLWVRDVEFVPKPRSAARRRAPNVLQRCKQAEIDELLAEGRARIGRLSEQEFLVAGTALYAGEGSKTGGEVRFANSDPRMIQFFCAWLRKFFEVDESRLRMRMYPARRPRPRCNEPLLVELDRHPDRSVPHAVPRGARSIDPHRQARARLSDGRLLVHPYASGGHGPGYSAAIVRDRPSGVAQLAEHRTVNAIVVGSSPTPGAPTAPRPPVGRGVGSFFVACTSYGPVAQWSEQATHNRSVGGSIPPRPTV